MSQRGGTSPKSLSSAHIDSLEFARTQAKFAVEMAASELSRLTDLTGDASGKLACSVVGERDSEGRCYLVVRIAGELRMRCQRCLQTLQWPINVRSRLLLVAPGAEWPDDELTADECDAIAADKSLPLLPLLEDEVILSLPLAPRHEFCDLPAAGGDNASSPFAGLVKLKKS